MDGPGRKSAAALSVAPAAPWARLEPPASLTEAQAAMWREIVATRPSEWFAADSAPVLEAYCQAVFSYRRTAAALDALDPSDSAYVPMAKLAGSQQQTIKTLATSLRLTPQSRFTPGAAATASKKVAAAKPWEIRHG